MDILTKFYVVDEDSVWHVQCEEERILVRRIACAENMLAEKVVLQGGTVLSIGNKLTMLHQRNIEDFIPGHWGQQSSSITALFLTEEEAQVCLDNCTDKRLYDLRWLASTQAVFVRIGEEHPFISICSFPDPAIGIPAGILPEKKPEEAV
jgi:hypothetical protein